MKKYILFGFIALLFSFSACKSHKTNQQGNGTSLENIRWKLTKLDAETISTPTNGKEIYIQLNKGKIDGFSGCNKIGGKYKINDNNLKITDIISTKMACPEMKLENTFTQALSKTESYTLKDKTLSLTSSDNSIIIFEAMN